MDKEVEEENEFLKITDFLKIRNFESYCHNINKCNKF